jgi:signal transduction histidine kinase/ligand-binding sensor domain-containing protein
MGKVRCGAMIVAGILQVCCACASALDPSLDISQYAHTAWKLRDGFTRGTILTLAQTPDGYLWLGTEFGLVRFDGVKATPWQPPAEQLPSNHISRLLVARDGTLWIGTSKGLARWKDGKLTVYPELVGLLSGLLEGRDGTIWAGSIDPPNLGKLCAIRKASMECHGGDGSMGPGVTSLYEDSKGNLWVGVFNGFWRWNPGPPRSFPVPEQPNGIRGFTESDDGTLLIGAQTGLKRLVNGKVEAYSLPGMVLSAQISGLLRDRDGGLWIDTLQRGLVHVSGGKADTFSSSDGLTADYVIDLLEDREGSLWVATQAGLDRFRTYSVPTISTKQGLTTAFSVLAAKDGSMLIGTTTGLDRWQQGTISLFSPAKGTQKPDGKLNGLTPHSLFQDSAGRLWASTSREFGYLEQNRFVPVSNYPGGYVHGITEGPPGHLWVASQQSGLVHIFQGTVIQQIPWAELGHHDFGWGIVADFAHHGLWLGFWKGGIAYFADGAIRASYSAAQGVGNGVSDLRFGPEGVLWASAEGGLSRIKDGRIATLSSRNGLPCDAVQWSMDDDNGSVWLYMPCGLVRVARTELDVWAADPAKSVKPTVFDITDGVQTHSIAGGYKPLVTKSSDGRIWFITFDGVSIIDPRHLPFNSLPPPVHIEQIIADRKVHDASNGLRLPPRVRDLEIDYTALSLVAPEKVRFRYKLEGFDGEWQDAGNRRQTFYTNLPPRSYRFRVLASNNNGVWNEQGDTLAFSIAPAYYQSTWFRLLFVAALLGLFYAFHRIRMHQQARQFNIRLDERVAERTRIARDLHDTMLQSFQGVMMKFETLSYILDRPTEAHGKLERLLAEGRRAIDEGRDAVRGMRSSTVVQNDLARALAVVGERLAAEQNAQNPVDFRVVVEGESRDLHPILRDEVYRIASEATCNAFRHSGAGQIQIEICYDKKQLRVRVQDNGKGIDPQVLDGGGREGHYGLPGMQERAKLAGGKLTVRSKLDLGTEVELTIPASIVYAKSSEPGPSIS